MSAEECKKHRQEKLQRRLCATLLSIIIAVLFAILVIWLVLRPKKPRFSIQDATVSSFNATSLNTFSVTLQVTIYAQNPNDKIGIYYERLRVSASYHGQQITFPTAILQNYQGHDDVTIWSPILYGEAVPVSPFIVISVKQDESAGILLLHFKVDGKLRWKVGAWTSGRYHIHASCPAYFTYSSDGDIRLQHPFTCHVDV